MQTVRSAGSVLAGMGIACPGQLTTTTPSPDPICRRCGEESCKRWNWSAFVLFCGTKVADVLRRARNAYLNPGRPKMTKSTTMTVRISPEVSDKLEVLARDTKRSKAYLASEAIASYVEHNAWQVARITASLEDAKSGGPGVPHAAVEQWVKSWDTEDELPRPEAKP